MSDRKQPPEGYRVYEMGAKPVGHTGELRDRFTSRAVLTSDGEHWTLDDAVAACEAHHDRIAAGAVAAVVKVLSTKRAGSRYEWDAYLDEERAYWVRRIESGDLPEPAVALHRLLTAARESNPWRQEMEAIRDLVQPDHTSDESLLVAVQRVIADARRAALEEAARTIGDGSALTPTGFAIFRSDGRGECDEVVAWLRELARQGDKP